jgi:toxin YoeB
LARSERFAGGSRRQAILQPEFITDLRFWAETNPRISARLVRLVDEIVREPVHGIGKPEPLRHLSGTWSRRLTDEHRLTYRVTPEAVEFLAARYHYR